MLDLRIDYNLLAPTYDDRYAVYGLDGIGRTLIDLVERDQPENVLETGCGSGYWLYILLGRVAHLFGLDYSISMLQIAGQRALTARLARGDAQNVPLAANLFDLVFCVNAIHHFGDPAAYVAEVKRLLRSGGTIAIFGPDPHHDGAGWYVYRYFPEAYDFDLRRFPCWETLNDLLVESGFTDVQFAQVDGSQQFFTQDTVFDDPFLKKSTTSQLASLTEKAYQEGLARIRNAVTIARINNLPLGFRTDIPFYCLRGRRA